MKLWKIHLVVRNVGRSFLWTKYILNRSTNALGRQNQSNMFRSQCLQLFHANHGCHGNLQRQIEMQNMMQVKIFQDVNDVGEHFLGMRFNYAGSTSVSLLTPLTSHGAGVSPLLLTLSLRDHLKFPQQLLMNCHPVLMKNNWRMKLTMIPKCVDVDWRFMSEENS